MSPISLFRHSLSSLHLPFSRNIFFLALHFLFLARQVRFAPYSRATVPRLWVTASVISALARYRKFYGITYPCMSIYKHENIQGSRDIDVYLSAYEMKFPYLTEGRKEIFYFFFFLKVFAEIVSHNNFIIFFVSKIKNSKYNIQQKI